MDLKTESTLLTAAGTELATALTFDDVLLVPRHSTVAADAGGRHARG